MSGCDSAPEKSLARSRTSASVVSWEPAGLNTEPAKVKLSLRSRNPYAVVAAVRQELRRAGYDRATIRRFSDEALRSGSLEQLRRVVRHWAEDGNDEEPCEERQPAGLSRFENLHLDGGPDPDPAG